MHQKKVIPLPNYGSGRESCHGTDKGFSPRLGVLSGFVFQSRSPGDTTLSKPGYSHVVSLRLAACKHESDMICCTAKVFSPRLGVLPGSFFDAIHRGTLPLASPGILTWFLQGWHRITTNWSSNQSRTDLFCHVFQNNKNSSSTSRRPRGVAGWRSR